MNIIIPTEAVTSTTSFMSDLIVAVFPFVSLAIGIPLAFYVIDRTKKISPSETDKIKERRSIIEKYNKKYGENYKDWK